MPPKKEVVAHPGKNPEPIQVKNPVAVLQKKHKAY